MWGVRGRALSHPRLPALWAGCRGPLPTGCGCGGVQAWGPVTNPTARALVSWFCALWGRHEGARGGRLPLGCGASGVGRSPTPDCPPSGRAAGAHYPLAVGAGGAGVGTRHQPHSARSCVLCGRHEGARGGRLLPGCGASGFGRSPTPDCPPSGRAAGAHYRLAVGAGGCGRGDPSPTPQRALLRAVFAHFGGGMRAPGRGASGLGVGRPGSGALPPPTARPLGGLPGPTTHWLWVRGGAGVGTRHQPHSARSCELALRAVGAARGRPGGAARGRPGEAPPAWVWGVRGRALSHPRLPAHWVGCQGPLPTGCGCGGCGRGGPSPTPQRALLRAGFARCGGGTRAPGGGALLPGCGASGVGRSPNPRLPALWAGCRGPLPTCCGCGGVGAWGPVTNPTARALACCEGGMRVPGGGASCLAVGRPGSGALPARGPLSTGLGCGGVRAWGPVTNPTAGALASWLCALWGRHEGARGGAPLARVWGVRGRALYHPRLPALWAGCRGPLPSGCGCGGMRAWGPVTNPTARALASWLCALWGRHEGAREGRLLPGCGTSGVGRSPTPDCPPTGRPAGAHYPLAVGAGGCRRRGPSPTPQRALLRAGFARCWGGTRMPGGGAPCLGVGRPGSGALPSPTARPLGGLPGPTTHWLWVRGVRAWGPVTNPTARALACCGGGMRVPRGGASCLGVGRPGSGALPPPTARPLGGLPGPTSHWLWVRGEAGVGTRHQPHSARSCELGCRAVGAARGCPGGPPLPGCGASGVGRSPTPDCPPSGRAAGAHYPLAVGAGGWGRGDPSPTPQRALLPAAGAA